MQMFADHKHAQALHVHFSVGGDNTHPLWYFSKHGVAYSRISTVLLRQLFCKQRMYIYDECRVNRGESCIVVLYKRVEDIRYC